MPCQLGAHPTRSHDASEDATSAAVATPPGALAHGSTAVPVKSAHSLPERQVYRPDRPPPTTRPQASWSGPPSGSGKRWVACNPWPGRRLWSWLNGSRPATRRGARLASLVRGTPRNDDRGAGRCRPRRGPAGWNPGARGPQAVSGQLVLSPSSHEPSPAKYCGASRSMARGTER